MTAPRKTTSDKPSNLYRTDMPGGVAADGSIIKGGSAVWWKPDELPPRKKRPLDVAGTQFAGALRRAVSPTIESQIDDALVPASIEVGGQTVNLDELRFVEQIGADDIKSMFELNDLVAWAYIKSWTLTREVVIPARIEGEVTIPETRGIEPYPLPESPDDLLDLPRATYDAMQKASAKIYAEARVAADGFSVAAATNPASPTAASDD